MYLRPTLLVLVALAALALPAKAQLLDFSFSTTASDGAVISGQIDGLASSGASTPSQIIINTQPTGYTFGAPLVISTANGWQFLAGATTFSVSGGAIVGGSVGVLKPIGTGGDIQAYGFNVSVDGFTGANGIYQSIGGTVTDDFNTGGIPAANFALIVTPVPEPHQTALIFIIVGIGLLVGRKLRTRFSRQ